MKRSGYVKKLPAGVVYRGGNLWSDLTDSISYLYDQGKKLYKMIRSAKPLTKAYNFLGETGRDFVGSIPLVGQPINTALKFGNDYGFARKRKVGRPKKK